MPFFFTDFESYVIFLSLVSLRAQNVIARLGDGWVSDSDGYFRRPVSGEFSDLHSDPSFEEDRRFGV